MFLITLFIICGVVTISLISAKVWEERRKRKPLLLRLVSLGDEHVRLWSHEIAHQYSEYRHEAEFFVKKQLPLHSKNIANKSEAYLKDKSSELLKRVRNSKIFKKDEGISEFFRNISEKENGEDN